MAAKKKDLRKNPLLSMSLQGLAVVLSSAKTAPALVAIMAAFGVPLTLASAGFYVALAGGVWGLVGVLRRSDVKTPELLDRLFELLRLVKPSDANSILK